MRGSIFALPCRIQILPLPIPSQEEGGSPVVVVKENAVKQDMIEPAEIKIESVQTTNGAPRLQDGLAITTSIALLLIDIVAYRFLELR